MKITNKLFSFLIVFSITILSFSCSAPKKYSQKLSFAETVFEVLLPSPLAADEQLILEILDEVTGIALNPERFKMSTSDGIVYSARLPLLEESVIRYRYVKSGENIIIEKDIFGDQIHYRLVRIRNASKIKDYLANWGEGAGQVKSGELSGYIYDNKTESPLGEILVVVNGMQTYTSNNGYYKFESLPLGEFHLTALHINGEYEPFQQNAVIAENSITPASFGMDPAKLVNVTFSVTLPVDTNNNAVIRLLGNIYSLGNTFSDLSNGGSVFANRAPILQPQGDGKFSITQKLPSGTDLRYKYSMGDGFINAEHDSKNEFISRQLIVPSEDITIEDEVITWASKKTAAIVFNVSVPESTPASDFVSIQLNPYMWLEPIPMWKLGKNQWTYTLYSPLEYFENSQYRFCRNNQCGLADDDMTKGANAPGYQLGLLEERSLTINYQINNWFGLQPDEYTIQPANFPADNSIQVKGILLESSLNSKGLSNFENSLVNIGVSGANWLFLSPSWSFQANVNQTIGLNPGKNLVANDLVEIKDKTGEAGMGLAIYPQIKTNVPLNNYWTSSDLSFNWWQRWFDQYERFILNYADFCESHGIRTLIIGGSKVSAAFPGGILPNGNPSNVPYNIPDRWSLLLEKIRSRFSGQIGFALPYSPDASGYPPFISSVDFLLLEFDTSLSTSTNPTVEDLTENFNSLLDNNINKLYAAYQKPVILGINYFSVDGTASACNGTNSNCSVPDANPIDVSEQADVYQAILKSSIAKTWLLGIVSMDYNPSVSVKDASASINGKPAFKVLTYYFNNLN